MKNSSIVLSAILAGTALLPSARAQTSVPLNAASGFAVLAGAGITVVGTADSTTISGDIGSYPVTTITGLSAVFLNGTNQGGDTTTQNAQTDLLTAFNTAAAETPTTTFSPAATIGTGQTLTSGVYYESSSLAVSGTLTLNAANNPNAVWIFQVGSTLGTVANSQILLTNGAQAANVFWEVAAATTLGTTTTFAGNLMDEAAITVNSGGVVDGRLLGLTSAPVTLTNDIIGITGAIPEPADVALLIAGGLGLVVGVRRLRRKQHGGV